MSHHQVIPEKSNDKLFMSELPIEHNITRISLRVKSPKHPIEIAW
jgi:hypothetical protein